MADDQGVNEPEGQSQVATTPVADQQVSAGQGVQGDAPRGNSPEITGTDELGLTQDASDRTRQRVKELLDENKRLKESQIQLPQPVYEEFTPRVVVPQGGIPAKTDEFGNVNPAYMDYIEQRQVATEQVLTNNAVRAEAKEAIQAHPDIETNEALLNMARGVKTDSLVYPERYGGRELSLKESIDYIKSQTKAEKPSTNEPSQEKLDASLGVEGRPSQGVQRELSDAEYDRLRWGTAKGDPEAMMARMRNISVVNRKT